ncbi:MAG: hypothetical protein ACRDJW_22510 [Thermomicrobiales bacterium]
MNTGIQSEQMDQLDRAVDAACRLTAFGEVRAVHVVTERRPSYEELRRYRTRAEANGLALTVLGSGGVVLRSRRVKPPLVGRQDAGRVQAAMTALDRRTNGERRSEPANPRDSTDRRWAAPPGNRRSRWPARGWLGELHAMSEGTR